MAHPSVLPPMVRGQWIPMTWEDFLEWSPSEGKSEWVDGKGIAYVSNSAQHVRLVVFLGTLLNVFVRAFDLGEVFLETMLLRVPSRPAGRMPDILVVGRDDLDRVRPRFVDGPALLAVEVVSEESGDRDLVEKREEYARVGVREYVILDARPDHEGVTFLRLDKAGRYQAVEPDDHGRYQSAALPGFWLDPAWFLQEPLPNPTTILRRISPEAWRRLVDEAEREG